jgi:hypothetical protein
MTDITTTVDRYLAMWNEEDPARRAELIEQAWAKDGRYSDPVQEAEGHEALSAMVEGIHSHYPGQRFRRTSVSGAEQCQQLALFRTRERRVSSGRVSGEGARWR